MYDIDKELADMMYSVWSSVGKPFPQSSNGEEVLFQNLLGDYTMFANREIKLPPIRSTAEFKDAGVFVLRSERIYLALSASPSYVGHGHFDQGAFILYKDNVPIVIDPSIESYFDSTKDWYVSSSSHSVVQFAREGGKKEVADPFSTHLERMDYSALEGWNDTPRRSELIGYDFGENVDEITVKVLNPEGGTHYRNIRLEHSANKVIITDTVEDFNGEIRLNLPLALKSFSRVDNVFNCKGYYNVDVRIEVLGEKIETEKGRCVKMFQCNGTPMADIIRVTGKNKIVTIIE